VFQVVLSPSQYVKSLPSKKVRHHAIDALNIWFNVPEAEISVIKDAIDTLHNSSLMYVLYPTSVKSPLTFFAG
jgi:fusicocca-2,10(14)-diene synthase/ophiobolin F synthase